MEKYFKNIEGDHLTSISTGTGGEEITKEEYENILSVVRNCPTADVGKVYKLRTDLTWELVEAPAEPVDDEISNDEALNIILGGEV